MRDFSDTITWIVIADGEKALICRNDDTDAHPLLSLIRAEEIDNPPSRAQGSSRPGRLNDGAGGVRRSAVEETDWHVFAKEQFAKRLTGRLNKAALSDGFDRLVLFAPPHTLGAMRAEYHAELSKRIVKEVSRDLTNHPLEEIERQVASALAG